VTDWFRRSNLFDALLDELFSDPIEVARKRVAAEQMASLTKKEKPYFPPLVTLDDALSLAPAVPWDLLRLEWFARGYISEFLITPGWDSPPVPQLLEFPPPYDLPPKVPFYSTVKSRPGPFWAILCGRPFATREKSLRRARLERWLYDREDYPDEFDDFDPRLSWIRDHLDQLVDEEFPPESQNPAGFLPPPPHEPEELAQWARQGTHVQRQVAALNSLLPEDVQWGLSQHWDVATRLALVANPGVNAELLEVLSHDSQSCVRAVVEARNCREENEINPLAGEILTPSEILWLLVSRPTRYFEFAPTEWGDGSNEFAQAVANFQTDNPHKAETSGFTTETYATGIIACFLDHYDWYYQYVGDGFALSRWKPTGDVSIPQMFLGPGINPAGGEDWANQTLPTWDERVASDIPRNQRWWDY
jgi:hypothetical protein